MRPIPTTRVPSLGPVPRVEAVCLLAMSQDRGGRRFRARAAVAGVAALAAGGAGCGSASESASRSNTVPFIPHAVVPAAATQPVHRAQRARHTGTTTTTARMVTAPTIAGATQREPKVAAQTRTRGAPPPESGGDANSKTISTPGTATTTPSPTPPTATGGAATEAPAISVPAAGG